jgi:hypothetical protein
LPCRTSDVELLDAYSRAVIQVVEAVGPAVVGISVGRQEQDQAGAGSGVAITPDGYILTNDHVVQGSGKIGVRLYDGASLPAHLIGTDPATDLAVIGSASLPMPPWEFHLHRASWSSPAATSFQLPVHGSGVSPPCAARGRLTKTSTTHSTSTLGTWGCQDSRSG